VLAEIELLVKEYGVKEISFLDDNLTYNKKRAMAIFQGMIDRRLDLVWSTLQYVWLLIKKSLAPRSAGNLTVM